MFEKVYINKLVFDLKHIYYQQKCIKNMIYFIYLNYITQNICQIYVLFVYILTIIVYVLF